jgi:hypothetical protein
MAFVEARLQLVEKAAVCARANAMLPNRGRSE